MTTNTTNRPTSSTADLVERLQAECFDPVAPGAIDALTDSPKVRAIYASFVDAFPDGRFAPQWKVIEGDRAALGGIVTGTHHGIWREVPPTGLQIEVLGTMLVECSGGRLVDIMVVPDTLAIAEQLGLLPALGPKACELVSPQPPDPPADSRRL